MYEISFLFWRNIEYTDKVGKNRDTLYVTFKQEKTQQSNIVSKPCFSELKLTRRSKRRFFIPSRFQWKCASTLTSKIHRRRFEKGFHFTTRGSRIFFMVDGFASDSQYSVAILKVFRVFDEAKKNIKRKRKKKKYNFAIEDHETERISTRSKSLFSSSCVFPLTGGPSPWMDRFISSRQIQLFVDFTAEQPLRK